MDVKFIALIKVLPIFMYDTTVCTVDFTIKTILND